jgi:type IV secretory pathway VirB2 component (pilin)
MTQRRRVLVQLAFIVVLLAVSAGDLYAQGDPWSATLRRLEMAFTGSIAISIVTIAAVTTGIAILFAQGDGMRTFFMWVFGACFILNVTQVIAWAF